MAISETCNNRVQPEPNPILNLATSSQMLKAHFGYHTVKTVSCAIETVRKSKRTVITIELAHGLNCWSLSRYLHSLIPLISVVNLEGKFRNSVENPPTTRLQLPFEFTRLARSSGHILQLEYSSEGSEDNLGHQLCTEGPGQNVATDVTLLGARGIDLRGLWKRTLLKCHESCSRDEKKNGFKLTFLFAVATSR